MFDNSRCKFINMDGGVRTTVYLCLYLFVGYTIICRGSCTPTVNSGSEAFTVRHAGSGWCLGAEGGRLVVGECRGSPGEFWKWGSGHRLFHAASGQCLGLGARPWAPVLLDCGVPREKLWWRCTEGGVHGAYGMALSVKNSSLGTQKGGLDRWTRDNSSDSICHLPYQIVHTTLGNSFGAPCDFPFYHNGSWQHGCLPDILQEGLSWCSTTPDYDADQKWGYCPEPEKSCEHLWEHPEGQGSCFQYNLQSALSWSEARASCQSQGGDLLSLPDLQELTTVLGKDGYPSQVWIGLNQLDMSEGWQWSDGSPLALVKWNNGMPLHGSYCAVMNPFGFWENEGCDRRLPYICKKSFNQSHPEPEPAKPFVKGSTTCELGWKAWDGFCYQRVEQRLAADQAQQHCQELGGGLISLHSLADVEMISVNFPKAGLLEVWTGLTGEENPPVFRWTDQSQVSFTYWARNQPQVPARSTRSCVSYSEESHLWSVRPCENELPFVCKKKGNVSEGSVNVGCPTDGEWRRHWNSCYKVDPTEVLFKDRCDLTIMSRFEQAFVNSLIDKHLTARPQYFWMSLQDANSAGEYQWVTNDSLSERVTFTNWNVLEPALAGGCVVLTTSGKWEVKNCSLFKAGSICKKEIGPHFQPDPEPDSSLPCPPGWASRPGIHYCYKVFHEERLSRKRSWGEAERFCGELGAHLPSFSHLDELKALRSILEDSISNERYFWVGLNRRNAKSGSTWEWSDGRPISTAIFPSQFHEDDDYNRNCAAFSNPGRTPQTFWMLLIHSLSPRPLFASPFHCDAQLEWVCQIPRGKNVSVPDWYNPGGHHESSIFIDGSEFWFVNDTQLTYREAIQYCSDNGSRLATPVTFDELRQISAKLSEISADRQTAWWLDMQGADHLFPMRLTKMRYYSGFLRKCPALRPRSVFPDYNHGCWWSLPFVCEKINATSVEKGPTEPRPAGLPCDSGSQAFRDKCYTVIKPLYLSFDQANKHCQTIRGSLVTIANQAEQDFITYLVADSRAKSWIGLKFTVQNTEWVDGSSVNYINFNPLLGGYYKRVQFDPFDHSSMDQCAYMINDPHSSLLGTWDYTSCNDQQYVSVCQHYADKPEDRKVIGGLFQVGNHKYRVLQNNMSWFEAHEQCKQWKMDLASVADAYQQTFLTVTVSRSGQPLWIGLFSEDESHYRWTDHSHTVFSRWAPENHRGRCVYQDTDGFWRATDCEEELAGAICHVPQGSGKEIVFVLDGSARIEPQDFEKAKDFISAVMRDTWETGFNCDFAVVQYSNGGRTELSLTENGDWTKALDKVQGIHQTRGTAMTSSAIPYVLEHVFMAENGSKADSVKMIILLMSDLAGLAPMDITQVLYLLKRQNVHLFAIGVGDLFKDAQLMEKLKTITSDPDEKHLFIVNDYSALESIKSHVVRSIDKTESETPLEPDELTRRCPHKANGPNWIPFKNNCYLFQLTFSRWNSFDKGDVREVCKRIDPSVDILTIRNEEENEFVRKQLLPFKDLARFVWLGVFLDENVDRMKWYDGTNVQYSNWEDGRPVVSGKFIAGLDINGVWQIFTNQLIFQFLKQDSIVACKIDRDLKEEFGKSSSELGDYGNLTYHVIERKLTWYEALQACEQSGGHLSSAHDPAHDAHLQMISKVDGFPLWIGLSRQDASSSFEWSDGSRFDYRPAGFGDSDLNGSCVSVNTKGTWQSVNCFSVLEGAICYNSSVGGASPRSSPQSNNCPQGSGQSRWIQHRDYCYAFDMNFYNYSLYTMEDAKSFCETLDASSQLLTIRDQEENSFVSRYLLENPVITSRVWLGVESDSQAGQLLSWVDGSSLDFSNWENGTVSGAQTQLSCAVLLSSEGGAWRRVNCLGGRSRVVCKAPIRSSGGKVVLALFLTVVITLATVVLVLIYRRNRTRFTTFVRYERNFDDMDRTSIITETD